MGNPKAATFTDLLEPDCTSGKGRVCAPPAVSAAIRPSCISGKRGSAVPHPCFGNGSRPWAAPTTRCRISVSTQSFAVRRSKDNPFSESKCWILKYRPAFPDRFSGARTCPRHVPEFARTSAHRGGWNHGVRWIPRSPHPTYTHFPRNARVSEIFRPRMTGTPDAV